jgi:hypothetical protein
VRFSEPGRETACGYGRQLWSELEVRLRLLPLLDRGDLAPGGAEALGGLGKVVADGAVQSAEAVAGHGGVHVVLDVEVHVPV